MRMKPSTILFLLTATLIASRSAAYAQDRNTTRGTNAGLSLSSADDGVFLGYDAGRQVTTRSRNVIIGSQAAIGSLNTTSGDRLDNGATLVTGFTGQDHVVLGYRAAWQSTGSILDSVIIGYEAGLVNQGSYVVFLGSESGHSNTSGFDNVFIGERAGLHNTTGDRNVIVGNWAGFGVTTGFNNTAAGRYALSGASSTTPPSSPNGNSYNNTTLGQDAGRLIGNAETWNNTFIGAGSGAENLAGAGNTFIGAGVGYQSEAGNYNTFVGTGSGWDNNRLGDTTNGFRNTYMGTGSGSRNRTGNDNVTIGSLADFGRWSGRSATLIDDTFDNSGSAMSSLAQGDVARTSSNTGVQRAVTLGSYASTLQHDCITIGYSADGNALRSIAIGTDTQATHPDAVAIGYQAATHADNTIVLGNATTSSIDPGADGVTTLGSATHRYASLNTTTTIALADDGSDATIELKADGAASNNDQWQIKAADSGDLTLASFATGAYIPGLTLDNAGNLTVAGEVSLNSDARLKTNIRPIQRALQDMQKLDGKQYEWKPQTGRRSGKHFGLIAQDVQKVYPHLVSEDTNGRLSVRYQGLIPVLINAVNEQQEMLDQNATRLAVLENPVKPLLRQEFADLRHSILKYLADRNAPISEEIADQR